MKAALFTEHFAGCFFPHGFTIFVFISLDNKEIHLHMPPVHTQGPDILHRSILADLSRACFFLRQAVWRLGNLAATLNQFTFP